MKTYPFDPDRLRQHSEHHLLNLVITTNLMHILCPRWPALRVTANFTPASAVILFSVSVGGRYATGLDTALRHCFSAFGLELKCSAAEAVALNADGYWHHDLPVAFYLFSRPELRKRLPPMIYETEKKDYLARAIV